MTLIYKKNWAQHCKHVKTVLDILDTQQLYVKQSKCDFGQQKVQYLGHLISTKGVGVDLEKVEAMKQWPKPQNLKAIRGFLGLTGYHRRFIQDDGKIAAPLTRMLKENNFTWTAAGGKAFKDLNKKLYKHLS